MGFIEFAGFRVYKGYDKGDMGLGFIRFMVFIELMGFRVNKGCDQGSPKSYTGTYAIKLL